MIFLSVRRLLAVLLVLVVVATACSSEPSEVVVGVSDDAGDSQDSSQDAVADDSSPVEGPSTTTTTEAPTVTTLEAPQTTALSQQNTSDEVEILGPSMIGFGEWVVFRPAMAGEDECPDGVIGYQVDGELVHTYDELSFAGGVRLFNGTRGQDAFVLNCEESVGQVLFQGSAIMPEQGWPELTVVDLTSPEIGVSMEYSADFAWRGDVFTGFGTAMSGTPSGPELYGFDPFEETVEPLLPRVGERVSFDEVGVDAWLPWEWDVRNDDTVHHPTSFSHLQFERVDGALDDPLAEGDEFLSSDSAWVKLWMRSDGDESNVGGLVDATEWTFLADDGVRVVRHVPVGDQTVWVELFADAGDGSIDQDLPWLILDTLRIFEN